MWSTMKRLNTFASSEKGTEEEVILEKYIEAQIELFQDGAYYIKIWKCYLPLSFGLEPVTSWLKVRLTFSQILAYFQS